MPAAAAVAIAIKPHQRRRDDDRQQLQPSVVIGVIRQLQSITSANDADGLCLYIYTPITPVRRQRLARLHDIYTHS